MFTKVAYVYFGQGDSLYSKFGILWRLVYFLNKEVIGDNPNYVEAGVSYELRIPRFMKQKGVVYK